MNSPQTPQSDSASPHSARGTVGGIGAYRWKICALLFFVTTINYMDRQIIGVLKPSLQRDLGWNEIDYSNIVFFFQLAYALGQVFTGRFMDVVGVRIGYAATVVAWSLASLGHGLARSVIGFSTARLGLGVAESGGFPGAIKTISLWFPKKERALATGIFNAGTNMGALATPLIVPWLATRWGWPAAFYFTGSLGLPWVVLWLLIYHDPRRHPRLSARELEYIESDSIANPPAVDVTPVPGWWAVFARRATIAYMLAAALTAPVWWFYLYWVPDFFHKKYGLDLLHIGLPVAVVYLMADLGSVGGGWLSSHLIKRGWSVNAARKTAMLVCALAVVPVCFASVVTHEWIAVVLIGLAAAAHQGFTANNYTFVSDTTPKRSVSSAVGMGGLSGGLAGLVIAKVVGYVLQYSGSYFILFAAASSMYLIALLCIQLLVPRIPEADALVPDASH
jgi:ACS family hexuronate transporter-like MFS transporter